MGRTKHNIKVYQFWFDKTFARKCNLPTTVHAVMVKKKAGSVYLYSQGGAVNGWIPYRVIESRKLSPHAVSLPEAIKKKMNPKKKRRAIIHTSADRQVTLDPDDKDKMLVSLRYDTDLISKLKTLSGRKWDKKRRLWVIPYNPSAVLHLRSWGFSLDNSVSNRFSTYLDKQHTENSDLVFPPTIRPYQKEGVCFIEACGGRALITDEMGLGKTLEALVWLDNQGEEAFPAHIIVPATLKHNWAREAQKWMRNPTIYLIEGRAQTLDKRDKTEWKKHIVRMGDKNKPIIIINYDILADNHTHIKREKVKKEYGARCDCGYFMKLPAVPVGKIPPIVCEACGEIWRPNKKDGSAYVRSTPGWAALLPKPKTVILDEARYIKNKEALRSKATISLAKKAPHIIPMDGTPIESRPRDIFPLLNLVDPGTFPSMFQFAQRYCGATHNGWGWDFNGASNMDELHTLLISTFMLRRRKKDVLTELPPKQRVVIPLPIKNRQEYNKAAASIESWIAQKTKEATNKEEKNAWQARARSASMAEQLTRFSYLKQITVKGKIDSVIRWIEDYLESGKKLIVVAVEHFTIDTIAGHFKKIALKLDGRTGGKGARQKIVDRFQEDDSIRLLVGGLIPVGSGWTLTAAQDTVHVELGWNASQHEQAEDRVHRISQKADSVTAYYLLGENTIEEDIAELHDEKRAISTKIIDGEEVQIQHMLTGLMRKFSQRKLV